MTTYKPGDVVLVLFPFTEASAKKKRPALVVSPAAYETRYGDLVLVAVTSVPQPAEDAKIADWRAAGLIKESWLKPVIGSVAGSRIVKKLGELSAADRAAARAVLAALVDKEFRP